MRQNILDWAMARMNDPRAVSRAAKVLARKDPAARFGAFVGAFAYGTSESLGAGARTVGRTAVRVGRPVGKLGLYGGALLAGMGSIGVAGGLYEAYSAGQQWKSEEESDYMQKLLATAQQGPFGTGLRPYGMGSNFGGSAGMSLAMHYARNGTGIRNPLFSIASLASRDIRRSMS